MCTILVYLQNPYGSSIKIPEHQARLESIIERAQEVRDGAKAIDFTYPDIAGKMVSLSDFKGKLVFIDVWATWCDPCKQEIPALKELHEEYADNDSIVFMSVSVDKEEDKEAWSKFVTDNSLPGIQLFASGWGSV